MSITTVEKARKSAIEIAMDQLAAQQRELSALRNDSWNEARGVQARLEPVFNSIGRRSTAPSPLQGESPQAYRKRALSELKQYSTTWKNVDLSSVPLAALDVAEKQIVQDTMQEARRPTALSLPQDGSLVTRVTLDETGRHVKSYHSSDPGVVWSKFKRPRQYVRAFHGNTHTEVCIPDGVRIPRSFKY